MSEQISNRQARALLARETDELMLMCVRFQQEDGTPITFLDEDGNTVDGIVCDRLPLARAIGNFMPFPFEPLLPNDTDEVGQQAQLQICNVDQMVTDTLKAVDGVPKAILDVVLRDEPDHVQMGPFDFDVVMDAFDRTVVTLTLGHLESILSQGVPYQTYTPSNSKGMY